MFTKRFLEVHDIHHTVTSKHFPRLGADTKDQKHSLLIRRQTFPIQSLRYSQSIRATRTRLIVYELAHRVTIARVGLGFPSALEGNTGAAVVESAVFCACLECVGGHASKLGTDQSPVTPNLVFTTEYSIVDTAVSIILVRAEINLEVTAIIWAFRGDAGIKRILYSSPAVTPKFRIGVAVRIYAWDALVAVCISHGGTARVHVTV